MPSPRNKIWGGHLLALLAGGLITLSLAPFNIWLLSLLAPLAFWWLLQNLTTRQTLVRGWLFGLGVFGSGASWVYVSIHEHGGTPPLLAGMMTWSFVAGLALFFALQAWIWQRWFCKTSVLISWPALWVLMEALRSWLLTGFPWLLLGTAHLNSPFSGWAPVLGVYGVSGLSVLAGLLVFYTLKPSQAFKHRAASLVFLLVLMAAGLGFKHQQWTQPYGEPLEIGLVQGNIPQQEKWDPIQQRQIIQQYLQLSQQLGELDLLIWPETALPLLPRQAEPYLRRALQQAGEQAGLITGLPSRAEEQGRYYNSLVTAGTARGEYHKVKLVPFGEYVPMESLLRGLIEFLDLPMSSFIPGNSHPANLQVRDTLVAPLICYEVAYAGFSARQAHQSHWLLTVSNDSWFGTSIGPLQHFEMARFRALETARPMARATNNGITALIDHQGQVITRLPQFEAAVLKGSLQPREGTTPFMQTGPLPLWLLCMLLLEWQRYQLRRAAKNLTDQSPS